MRYLRCSLLLWAGCTSLAQISPPTFNAQTVLPANLSKAEPLQPGMLVSIYGNNLGPDEGCADHTRREPGELCDTTVTVNGVKAGLLYAQAKQLNLRLPRNLPSEGTLPFVITYKGKSSAAVMVRFAPDWAHISLLGQAYVHMPVWIKVELPGRLQRSARYPITIYPDDFGGHQFEVRGNGIDLPRRGASTAFPRVENGLGSPGGIGGGGFLGLPAEPKNAGEFPLHLLFSFDRPGRYQVRYTGYDMGFPATHRILVRSEWLSLDVQAQTNAQRAARLDFLRQPAPTDAVELLSEYLPSILASMDPSVLQKLEGALYHANPLVRHYAMYSLCLFNEADIENLVPRLIERRGPTNELAYLLSWRRNLFQARAPQLAQNIIAYLRSESPVVSAGAWQSLLYLRAHYDWKSAPQTPRRMDAAVLAVADETIRRGTRDSMQSLAEYLAEMKSNRSRELLWRLVDEGSVREQALICLTWIGDARDLPRIASYDAPNLDYHLNRAYGSAAAPYLKKRQNR